MSLGVEAPAAERLRVLTGAGTMAWYQSGQRAGERLARAGARAGAADRRPRGGGGGADQPRRDADRAGRPRAGDRQLRGGLGPRPRRCGAAADGLGAAQPGPSWPGSAARRRRRRNNSRRRWPWRGSTTCPGSWPASSSGSGSRRPTWATMGARRRASARVSPGHSREGTSGTWSMVFEGLARLAAATGRSANAARLFGAAATLREAIGSPHVAGRTRRLRAGLGLAARRTGRGAVRGGLGGRPGARAGGGDRRGARRRRGAAERRTRRRGSIRRPAGLTGREREILALARRRREQPRDRRAPVHQPDHGRPPPRQHLRQARRRLAGEGDRLRPPPWPRLSWSSCMPRPPEAAGQGPEAPPRPDGCSLPAACWAAGMSGVRYRPNYIRHLHSFEDDRRGRHLDDTRRASGAPGAIRRRPVGGAVR